MPGPISLAASHDPSFFDSIQVEGHDCRVVVAEREEQILGVGLIGKRRVYLNGSEAEVGYISSLRTDPSVRSTTVLGRGNTIFKRLHEDHLQASFYLCSILQANKLALKVFTSGRGGLPASREIGTLYTATIPLIRRVKPRLAGGISIIRGGQVGAEAIIECLNRCGSAKQFYPAYTVSELLANDGPLRGLRLDDFYAAISGDRVAGVMACWNHLAFRRMTVAGYSGAMRFAKPVLSPIARMLRLAPLPNAGDAIQSVLASCIAIEDNDVSLFKALLQSILHDQYATGKAFLMVGLMERDPLLRVARQYTHLPTRSSIYALQWGDIEQATSKLDDRLPYLELGSL